MLPVKEGAPVESEEICVTPMDEREEFISLWTAAQPVVASFILSVIPQFEDADDVLQDVSVLLYRKFSGYDRGRSFTAWAIGVARLEVLTYKRRRLRDPLQFSTELLDRLAELSLELEPELDGRSRALRDCLETMGAPARELIRLRFEEALPPRAIAERIGETSMIIRARLSRVRKKLRACVEWQIRLEQIAP